ncbi:MAG: translation initiation factor IF-2 N-terminal domain-containing protein, partial [Rubrobacteraceae bacterium]
MSKRVYEIAKELNLNSKEVIGRLKEAGVEVKSHSSSVDDLDYERIFGNGSNGRTEAQEEEAQEARVEAEHSGHNATISDAPAEEPVSIPDADRQKSKGQGSRKRRRVVIDASATNRGPRPTAAPRVPEQMQELDEEVQASAVVTIEPGATVKDLADSLGVPPAQIIKVLMGLGEMRTVTQMLSTEEIEL